MLEAVRIVRGELGPDQALVGFCGGPFTVAGYLVEGKPTRDFVRVKELMYREPGVWHALMDRLADGFAAYVAAQAAAGADVIQLFDSWVGVLSVADYEEFVAPYSARVLAAVDVPDHPLRNRHGAPAPVDGGRGRRVHRSRLAHPARRGLGGDRLPLGRAGQPRPGRAARAVGADRGDRARRPRPRRRPFRPRLQPRPRRPARDGSCGSVAGWSSSSTSGLRGQWRERRRRPDGVRLARPDRGRARLLRRHPRRPAGQPRAAGRPDRALPAARDRGPRIR